MHVGIAGEVRCVVTKADGTIKIDTGFQKNLILNQGLDFFGGLGIFNRHCAIGAGNSTPAIEQDSLDSFIAITPSDSTNNSSNYTYSDTGDNKYVAWEQAVYRFSGLDNVNISEVGLANTGTSASNYNLLTRALIRDSAGNPTTISVKQGEVLDIYYKVFRVIDTNDKSFVIDVVDGTGNATPYNVLVRPSNLGSPFNRALLAPLTSPRFIDVSASDLSDVTSSPSPNSRIEPGFKISSYVIGSFKRVLTIDIGLNLANTNIRSISSFNGNSSMPFFFFQMRFGRVSDDAPLTKTANDTLTIPLEISWGRYEGEL